MSRPRRPAETCAHACHGIVDQTIQMLINTVKRCIQTMIQRTEYRLQSTKPHSTPCTEYLYLLYTGQTIICAVVTYLYGTYLLTLDIMALYLFPSLFPFPLLLHYPFQLDAFSHSPSFSFSFVFSPSLPHHLPFLFLIFYSLLIPP